MHVEEATAEDVGGFVELAAGVEHLFGPMVHEPAFHGAVRRSIARGSALIARDALGTSAGGLLFARHCRPTYVVRWLVVAADHRSRGLGQALVAHAFRRWVHPPCTVEVVAFGPDHPGARSRRFYERLGFDPAERADAGPDGGSRQVFRAHLEQLPAWATPGHR